MGYETYKLEDFLVNAEFKNWVLHPTNSSQLFWEKWLEAYPDQKEVIESAREIILTLKFQQAEKILVDEKEDILKNVLNRHQIKQGHSRKVKTFRLYYGVAASLFLLLSFLFYVTNRNSVNVPIRPITQIVKENMRGQKTKITLPDGSKVWLNSESRIEYPSVFNKKRAVSLKGEAFFEIAKNPDKPFEVYSNGVLTTALGTSFNINTFNKDEVEVGLVTGKVSVEMSNQNTTEKVFISPGEMAVYHPKDNLLKVQAYEDLDFIKWTNRIIVFKRANLQQIQEKLERWYDVTINVKNPNRQMTFTGEFNNESLEMVLERMAFVEKFDFEVNDKQVTILF